MPISSSFEFSEKINVFSPFVSTAEIGDLIESVKPWSGLSLWGVYVGEGHIIHFGVGGKNLKCDFI